MAKEPNLTFFCELPAEQLKTLFADNQLIKQLQQLRANISLGLLDLTPERAAVTKKLVRAGIPVTAWLLLPKEKGYWTSLDTVVATSQCYADFKIWTAKNNLTWAAVGLDIEPRLERMKLLGKAWKDGLPDLIRRLFSVRKYKKRESDLRALINQIRCDGFPVETYNFPFVVEERKAESDLFSRILGTPALEADREVLMLYSSFFDKNGDAILWSYAHQAQGIGLGSTGGGVELGDGAPLREMRWVDLRRDLLIANTFTPHIYVFSLEGCVKNRYLDRLTSFDWNAPISQPVRDGNKVTVLRKVLQALLWLFSHPFEVILGGLVLHALFKKKK